MKCILAKKVGNSDDVLEMADEWPRPTRANGQLLIRVLACALCPADTYLLSGKLDLVLKPPSWPYTPGIEMAGVVEEADPANPSFRVGDVIYASSGRSNVNSSMVGGLAHYAVIPTRAAVAKPATVPSLEAAALGSASVALRMVTVAGIKKGDRVLVLGGGGGIGTAAVQLARAAGASYIAATSTNAPLMASLGVDRTIDYRRENWWQMPEFLDKPFDAVLETVSGGTPGAAWRAARSSSALRTAWSGGRFISSDFSPNEVHNVLHLARFVVALFWPGLCAALRPWALPRYKALLVMPDAALLTDVMKRVASRELKIVMDPSSPFPFTLEGVKAAFRLQAGRHAHGRVVVQVSDE